VGFGLWLLGALLALLPAFAGSLSLRRLERRARRRVEEDWLALLEAVRQRLGLKRRVALLVSPERDMPMAWGCWRPKVLLPCEAENWSQAKRRMVLLHELAHVRRWDCLTKLVTRGVCAVYWFNPLVWLAARRLAAQREQACDDLVLSAGMRAPDYAEQLVAIAGALQSGRLAELGAIPMARPSKLGQRVRAILDPRRSRAGLTLTKVLVAVVAVAGAVVPLAMLRQVAQAADPAAPAAPPAGGEPMRHFVRLVVGPTSLTLEGREVSWEQLPDLLRKIPDRSRTVLEIAASTDQLTLAQFEPARDQAGNLARDLGFEYLSYVGIHPLGSKGSPPARAAPPATTPEASAGAQASEAELRTKLNEDQRAVAEWTGRQFRSFLDHRTYAGLSAPERADLETRLVDSLEGPKNRAYYEAINSLGALRSRKAVAPLLKIAAERIEKDNRDRWMAIRALGLIGDPSVVPEMVHLAYHPNVNTRWWAQLTLVRLTGQNFGKDWEAWGRWWNAQGGQPPFQPEKVTWTANPDWGSPEALEAGDRKFLDDLKQRGFGREAPASSPRSAVEAAELRPVASSSAAEPEPPVGLTGAIVLKREGGVTAGKRSLGASGHAVQFARPGGARFVEAVYIYASRYGTPEPPGDNFHVYLLNEKKQVLADLPFAYALIERGDMKWYALRTPSVEVPADFTVALAFNPHQTKGVYLGYADTGGAPTHSYTGLPEEGFEKLQAAQDWMVRVCLAEQPSGAKGTQRLADWKLVVEQQPLDGCTVVTLDNGKPEGKQSYGGRGPAVRFRPSEFLPAGAGGGPALLKGVRLYASRYGSGYDAARTLLQVYALDPENQVLGKAGAPYARFNYKERWVDLVLEKPIRIEKPGDPLTVALDPEAAATKGIYFHYQKNPARSHSLAGKLGKGFESLNDREWLIRPCFQVAR
jgi:hypothetical protein